MLASALLMLQAVLLLLLLAVCGNTANLMLARASARYREMGMRMALGAPPWRVAALLLTETLTMALVGAALGAAIATWATEALRAVPFITAFPIKFQTEVDAVSLAFAMALGVASGLLFGIAPALQLARIDPQTAIRFGSRSAGPSAMRNTLMAVEVALALVVLMAAGLFFRSFSETRDTDPGFRHFNFDGQTAAIEDYLEVRAAVEPEVRRFVEEGRLAVGPWRILMDEFLCSPETIIRNLRQGHERAERLGGTLDIDSVPGTGTRVSIRISCARVG